MITFLKLFARNWNVLYVFHSWCLMVQLCQRIWILPWKFNFPHRRKRIFHASYAKCWRHFFHIFQNWNHSKQFFFFPHFNFILHRMLLNDSADWSKGEINVIYQSLCFRFVFCFLFWVPTFEKDLLRRWFPTKGQNNFSKNHFEIEIYRFLTPCLLISKLN